VHLLTTAIGGWSPFHLFIKGFLSFDQKVEECVITDEKGSISEMIVRKIKKQKNTEGVGSGMSGAAQLLVA
jgi:hypothetical protein